MVNGDLVSGPPKSHRARTIVIPRLLADELAPVVERDELILTSPFLELPRGVWKPAVADRGLGDLVPHDLRHTAAGLAKGVPIKVVSERLGHTSVAFTMQVYQHSFPACKLTPPPRSERWCSGAGGPSGDYLPFRF